MTIAVNTTAPRELVVTVNIAKDMDTGTPVVAFAMGFEEEGVRPNGFFLKPETAQNIGALLIGAAANAAFFEQTNEYMGQLQQKGWHAHYEALQHFMEWMGEPVHGEI